MSLNGKAFTGLQMHSLQGGSLLYHYCAGPSLPCWNSVLPPCLLWTSSAIVCKAGARTCLGPQSTDLTSDLSYSLHLPEQDSLGQKNGWKNAAEVRTWSLKPYFFFQVPWIELFAVCARAAQWQWDHCREKYLWVCTLLVLPALEEAVWGTPWGWCSKMSTSWQPNKGQSKC